MIRYFPDLEQGSDAWLAARCGLLTASEMKLIIRSDKLIYDLNDDEKAHIYEIASQRITGYTEQQFISFDMQRGNEDELRAKIIYNEKVTAIEECGFITNDNFGFTLGYSPDFLVGEDGLGECKSRRQKWQFETIALRRVPAEFVIQIQTGLLVSGRQWLDFLSYCGGMKMMILRVYPDSRIQNAIISAAGVFERNVQRVIERYKEALNDGNLDFFDTERVVEKDITLL